MEGRIQGVVGALIRDRWGVGLVAEGRSVAEALDIARWLDRAYVRLRAARLHDRRGRLRWAVSQASGIAKSCES
ncbi:hypothetical protein SBA4_2120026 [Candidatus Sulfopaludibacter sp. SbA4]|nr:hypothetical protein SBA4_2120026 [Candidatus Sulfopaludibacter sp. SbA4]